MVLRVFYVWSCEVCCMSEVHSTFNVQDFKDVGDDAELLGASDMRTQSCCFAAFKARSVVKGEESG